MSNWLWNTGVAALAMACVASPATAQNASSARPAPINWTGFYLGADLGLGFQNSSYQRPATTFPTVSIGAIKVLPTYNFRAGFNYQFAERAIVGLEASLQSFDGGKFNEFGPTLDFLHVTRYIEAISGRLGYIVSADTMVYGKLGPARINVSGSQGFTGHFDSLLDGFVAGVGFETFITSNIALRAEATYRQSLQTLTLNSGQDLYKPSFMQISLGASYKFDAPSGWGVGATGSHELSSIDPMAAPNWTGFELGGFGSLNGSQMKYFDTQLTPSTQGPYSALNGGGGAFIGFNYQFVPSFLVGIEMNANWHQASFYTSHNGGASALGQFANLGQVYALTARAGWLATPGSLLYLKFGPSWMHFSTNTAYWNAVAPNTPMNKFTSGYQLGFGLETFITSNVSVRVEGLFDRTSDHITEQGNTPNQYWLQPAMLTATAGVAIHF